MGSQRARHNLATKPPPPPPHPALPYLNSRVTPVSPPLRAAQDSLLQGQRVMDLSPPLGAWRDPMKVPQQKLASCWAHPPWAIPWEWHTERVNSESVRDPWGPGGLNALRYPGPPGRQPPHSQTHCILNLLILSEACPAHSSPHTPALHRHAGKPRQGRCTLVRCPR